MPENAFGIFFVSVMSNRQEITWRPSWLSQMVSAKHKKNLFSDKISLCRYSMYRLENIFHSPVLFSPIIPIEIHYPMSIGPLVYKGHVAWKRILSLDAFNQFAHKIYSLEKKWNKGKKELNLNPGFVNSHGVFLASRYPDFNRLYMAQGIYSYWLMKFQKGRAILVETNYAEYHKNDFLNYFQELRHNFHQEDAKKQSHRKISKRG